MWGNFQPPLNLICSSSAPDVFCALPTVNGLVDCLFFGQQTSLWNYIWAVLSDEQMSNGWPFSLLNDEQMSNWVGVKHQPDMFAIIFDVIQVFETEWTYETCKLALQHVSLAAW